MRQLNFPILDYNNWNRSPYIIGNLNCRTYLFWDSQITAKGLRNIDNKMTAILNDFKHPPKAEIRYRYAAIIK